MSFDSELKEKLSLISSEWNEDQLIRYLILSLAPLFHRDVSYYLNTTEKQYEMYLKGFRFKGPKVVCTSLCLFYLELFKEYNIKCIMIKTNDKLVPHNALKVLGTNGWYFIDPLKDLLAHQYGLMPSFYGNYPKNNSNLCITQNNPELIMLSSFYIKNLDRKIKNTESIYMNEVIDSVSDKFKNHNNWVWDDNTLIGSTSFEKRMFAIQELFLNIGEVDGPYERMQLLDYLIAKLFNRIERNKISTSIVKGPNGRYQTELTTSVDDKLDVFIEENQGKKYVLRKIT